MPLLLNHLTNLPRPRPGLRIAQTRHPPTCTDMCLTWTVQGPNAADPVGSSLWSFLENGHCNASGSVVLGKWKGSAVRPVAAAELRNGSGEGPAKMLYLCRPHPTPCHTADLLANPIAAGLVVSHTAPVCNKTTITVCLKLADGAAAATLSSAINDGGDAWVNPVFLLDGSCPLMLAKHVLTLASSGQQEQCAPVAAASGNCYIPPPPFPFCE